MSLHLLRCPSQCARNPQHRIREPGEPRTRRHGLSQAACCIIRGSTLQHCMPYASPAGLVLAWTHAIATGDGDIAVIIAEPESRAPASVCQAGSNNADGSGAAAEAIEAGGWSRFFSPMAHLCVFSSQHVSDPLAGGAAGTTDRLLCVRRPAFEQKLRSINPSSLYFHVVRPNSV